MKPYHKIGHTTEGNPINVRKEMDIKSTAVTTLDPGTEIQYEEVDKDWVKVTGYIMKKYVR